MKYYAINWYAGGAWVESGDYSSSDKAEIGLARYNPQIILDQDEMRGIIEAVINDFPDIKKGAEGKNEDSDE